MVGFTRLLARISHCEEHLISSQIQMIDVMIVNQ